MIDDLRLDQLTREMGWIRGLARALVTRDADDLAQDAWLVAAEQAPTNRPLRPWLSRVTQNLARMRGRSASRRERRELAVETRATPSPAELVERVELGRVVAAEVIALDEPYRSTVLLHFFEGLSSAEIARRQAVPDGTVRRRLKVGLDQLRERLRDRRDPPKGGWLAALIPMAGPLPRIKAVAKPAAAVATSTTTIVVVLIAIAIVAGAIWKLASNDADDAPISTAPAIAHVYPVITPPAHGARPLFDPLRRAQPGAPSRRVAGIVRFAGVPVADAVVHLGVSVATGSYPEAGPMFQRVARVTTDADGRFDFGLRPAARYLVTAQATTRAPVSQTIEAADPRTAVETLELALGACTTTLAGRVRDAQGTGLVAHVETLELAAVDTSAAGDYTLCLDAPPAARGSDRRDPAVRVSADGYATIQRGVSGTGELHVDVVLVPAAAASGRVVDEQDHPVAGARVIAWPAPFGTIDYAAAAFAVTDDDGRFEIDHLAPGRWWIKGTATDVGQSQPALATIAPGAPATAIRLVVTPRAHVRGRVVRDGAAVTAAEVQMGDLHAYTQADGTFAIDGVEPGMTWVRIGDELVSPDEILVDRADLDIELSLLRHNQVVGHVTQSGIPVAAVVHFVGQTTLADASGAYTIGAPVMHHPWEPPRRWSVNADLSCDPTEPTAERAFGHQFVVLASNQGATVDIDLRPCGPIVHPVKYEPRPPEVPGFHGVVVDKAGAGVVGALVRVAGNETTTDVHGAFTMDVMTAGIAPIVFPSRNAEAPFPLLSRGGDGTTAPAQLVVDADLIAIRGRVVDTAGAPVADARVQIRGVIGLRAAASPDEIYVAITGIDGAFTIDHLAHSSSYTITAMAGTLRGEVHGVAGDVDIVVGGNGSIHGELLGDWDGAPVMTARPMGSRTRELTVTIGDDDFDVVDLPPGPYEVTAYDGIADRTAVVWVQSGKVAHTSLFGHDHKHRQAAHIVELGTARPIIGMACQAGEHSPIIASDEQGVVESQYENHLTCWSSRGPYVAVTPYMSCGPACGSEDNAQVVALVRPGTARPGFVVAPLSLHPTVAVVDDDGSAKEAGLHAGDAIIELDGAGVAQLSPQELMYLVWTHPRGALRLAVDRDGSRRDIAIPIRE